MQLQKVLTQISEEEEPSQSVMSGESDKFINQSPRLQGISYYSQKQEITPKSPTKFSTQESIERIKKLLTQKSSIKDQEDKNYLNISKERLEIGQKSPYIQEQSSQESLKLQKSFNQGTYTKPSISQEQISLSQISSQKKSTNVDQVKSSSNVLDFDSRRSSKKIQGERVIKELVQQQLKYYCKFLRKKRIDVRKVESQFNDKQSIRNRKHRQTNQRTQKRT